MGFIVAFVNYDNFDLMASLQERFR